MSVLNAPNEWEWSYYLMILAHIGIFATAAGRAYGLDGVLRPIWRSSGRPAVARPDEAVMTRHPLDQAATTLGVASPHRQSFGEDRSLFWVRLVDLAEGE